MRSPCCRDCKGRNRVSVCSIFARTHGAGPSNSRAHRTRYPRRIHATTRRRRKKKKKDAGLAESCLFCAGLQLEERSFCACCLNGRERRERVWTPEGFLFSALDFSAFCFGRFVTRPQSACCDSSNHNSRVRLAITRDELFYFGALLDKQAECIMTGVKEPLV